MAIKPITWALADFAGGIDTRDGQFSERQNSFRELTNYRLTKGKKLVRRWPYIEPTITLPRKSQGLIPFAGALRVVQAKADYVPGVFGAAPLTFDTPDNCTSEWELVDWSVFGTTIGVWIRHGYQSAQYPYVCRFHVLGGSGLGPTYVEDPYCPSNWRGGLIPKPSISNYSVDWRPCIVAAQGKAYVGDANGDIGFCKTGNLRAWNTKSITALVENGQEYAFVVPDASGSPTKTWKLTEAWEDFQLDAMQDELRFTAYLLEAYDAATDTWQVLTEDRSAPTAHGHFRLREVANRWGGAKTETALDLYWTTPGSAILRLRLILDERASLTGGGAIAIASTTITVASASYEITSDGVTKDFATDTDAPLTITDPATWVLCDDSGVTTSVATETPSAVSYVHVPPTGFERWHNLVLGYLALTGGALTQRRMILDETWQATRKIALATYAGENDAGLLNTSFHTGAGGTTVTALAVLRQRLLVWYDRSSQLWQLGPLAADHALIDTSSVGTGEQPTPEPAPLVSTVLIATPLGIRQFQIQAMLEAYIDEIGIGEQLERLSPDGTVPTQLAACYWPFTGEYLTAIELNGEVFFLCFAYFPTSKVAGWQAWKVAGLGGIPGRKSMAALEHRMYVRIGDTVRCFDATPGLPSRDVTDLPGRAFESKAVAPFNDFKQPGSLKQSLDIDVVQTGRADFALRYNPADEAFQTAYVTIDGSTRGRGLVPLPQTGPAFALVLTSRDERGHELQSVAIRLIARSR